MRKASAIFLYTLQTPTFFSKLKIIIIVNDNKKLFKKCWNLNVHCKSSFYWVYIYLLLWARAWSHTHLVLSVHRDTGKNLRRFTWRPTYLSPHRKRKRKEKALTWYWMGVPHLRQNFEEVFYCQPLNPVLHLLAHELTCLLSVSQPTSQCLSFFTLSFFKSLSLIHCFFFLFSTLHINNKGKSSFFLFFFLV